MKNFALTITYTNGCEKYWWCHNMDLVNKIIAEQGGYDDVANITVEEF